ncbi:MAG: TolC family protein [Smithella sp.]
MIAFVHYIRWKIYITAPILGAFLLFMTVPVSGNESLGLRITVVDAVRIALAENHELKAMKSAVEAQGKDVGIARSYLLPRIFMEERYLRTTNPGYAFMARLNQERIEQQDFNPDLLNHPDAINDFQSSLTFEQPLFVKKAFVSLDMAKTESRAKGAEFNRKREDTAFQVVRACLTIVSAREHLRAVDQGIEDAREHHRMAMSRYKNGLGLYADTLRTSTALTEARQKRNVAEKNLKLAERGLGLMLAMTESVSVEDETLDLRLRDLSYYVKCAESRSDLLAAGLREENSRHNIRLAEAGYYPYIGVGGTYQLNDHSQPFGSEGTNWQVAAFLRWDLFDGAKSAYERAKAKHLSSQAREYVSALKKGVDYRIYEAYLNAEQAAKNAELTREALQTSKEGTRLVKVRYANGLSSLAELLNAQSSLEQARAGVVERENDYKIALATLSHESGTILQDLKID